MKASGTWLLGLLLLGLALRGAANRAHQHSMEIRSECQTPAHPPPLHPRGPRWGLAPSRAGAMSSLSAPEPEVWPSVPQPLPNMPCPARGGGFVSHQDSQGLRPLCL